MQSIEISSHRANNISLPEQQNQRFYHHSRQKTPLKVYNSNINQFEYEAIAKHKRIQLSEYMAVNTPSNISIQSVTLNNDIYSAIPCVQELLSQTECRDESYVTLQEAFNLLKKLRINNPYSKPQTVFKYLRFKNEQLKIEELFRFLTTDVLTIDFQELSKEELILKFGIEVFRAVGKESLELKIMDVIQYLKDHKSLGFDLTQIFELFDFYKSEISGSLKNKLTINAFFNKSASILYQVFSPEYIAKIRQIIAVLRQDPLRSQQGISPSVIKSYDPEKNHASKSKSNYQEISTTGRREIDFQNTATTNRGFHSDLKEPNLEDVFFEVHPKNKGWLMRRSRKHNNKWSMAFCEITEGRFISAQPTNLKKSIEIKHIDIHKCNFLEIINRFDFSQTADVKKGHSRTGSHGYRIERGPPRQSMKLDFCFFILDNKNQKTYLIRSAENLIIGSIIHFYLNRDKYTQLYNEMLSPLFVLEPEFSGVIEIATCKKKNISRFHSSLKSYTFKKQFLIIKNGKFNIYDMKMKDNINLCEYETKAQAKMDILPQTNPFIFALEKLDSRKLRDLNLQTMKESLISEADEVRYDEMRTNANPSIQAKSRNEVYAETELIEEKKPSKGLFREFFENLIGGGRKKNKEEKITLACDTEMKRRQWTLTLSYFITQYTRAYVRHKSIGGKDSNLNTFEDMNTKSAFHTEIGGESNLLERRKKKNKPSLTLKNAPQDNPDFYDIYAREAESKQINQPNTEQMTEEVRKYYEAKQPQKTDNPKNTKLLPIQQDKSNLPLITEPDANNPLDSDEILLTFTQFNAENLPTFLKNNPNANNQINLDDPMYLFTKEIKTLSDIELWQKFLIFFLKEKHPCTHLDLQDESPGENIRSQRHSLDVPGFDCELIEDEPAIRTVLTDQYNVNSTR